MVFPTLLLALILIAMLGPGLENLMIAIGIGSVPMFARVLRAETLSVRERDYVLASQAIGANKFFIVFNHILPNILSSMIVLSTTRVATAILSEAALSFLGLGIQPPTPSWGSLVADGRAYLERAPWMALVPGVVIMITVLGFNLFGDGLRDVVDVRRHGRQ
jgi:peptide/nickel transport system permease protein